MSAGEADALSPSSGKEHNIKVILREFFFVVRLKPNTICLVQQFDVLIYFLAYWFLPIYSPHSVSYWLIKTISLLIFLSIHLSFNYLTNKLNASGLFSPHYNKRKITLSISSVWGSVFCYWVWSLFKLCKWFLRVNVVLKSSKSAQCPCPQQQSMRVICCECRESRWWKNKVRQVWGLWVQCNYIWTGKEHAIELFFLWFVHFLS